MSHDHFCTPDHVCDLIEKFFDGPVDLDPATNKHSHVRARTIYTQGALFLPWKGTVYGNFPYSIIGPFVDKGIAEMKAGRCTEMLLLKPANTSTDWWRRAMAPKPRVIFTKRLAFRDPFSKAKDSARFDTALIYYGKRRKRFVSVFKPVESWTV